MVVTVVKSGVIFIVFLPQLPTWDAHKDRTGKILIYRNNLGRIMYEDLPGNWINSINLNFIVIKLYRA